MLITELKISHDKYKYYQHLAKVERIKFEMADKYRLHPSNYITKKYDVVGNYHLHGNYRRSSTPLVGDWDENRIDTIGANGNEGLHYEYI
jgi:hypothetical protein